MLDKHSGVLVPGLVSVVCLLHDLVVVVFPCPYLDLIPESVL